MSRPYNVVVGTIFYFRYVKFFAYGKKLCAVRF